MSLPVNPNGRTNADVLRPWANGQDITQRPSGQWIIDFGVAMLEQDAALYEVPFQKLMVFSFLGHALFWFCERSPPQLVRAGVSLRVLPGPPANAQR